MHSTQHKANLKKCGQLTEVLIFAHTALQTVSQPGTWMWGWLGRKEKKDRQDKTTEGEN